MTYCLRVVEKSKEVAYCLISVNLASFSESEIIGTEITESAFVTTANTMKVR